jgi:Ca2+:H+ antiporter
MHAALRRLAKPSLDWLFVFLPVALWLEHAHAAAPWVFFAAALAIVPAAHLMVVSTEKIAEHTGDAVGGLLNATFGNMPELIIALVALRAGMHDLVLGSIAGALLANMLLSGGLSFFLGGLRFREQEYNPTSLRLYSSMMLIAVISLLVPSAFYRTFAGTIAPAVMGRFNVLLAVLLLTGYALYLLFSLHTHKALLKPARAEAEHPHGASSPWRAVVLLLVAAALAAWMSEVLVGAAEATGQQLGLSPAFLGMIVLAVVGGAAETISAVAMARKNRMDMSLGIAMGSCVQIALFVTPVLVLASFVVGEQPLLIHFGSGAIVAVFFSVLVSAFVAADGRSNWHKGVQLLLVYVIIGSMLYFVPEMR